MDLFVFVPCSTSWSTTTWWEEETVTRGLPAVDLPATSADPDLLRPSWAPDRAAGDPSWYRYRGSPQAHRVHRRPHYHPDPSWANRTPSCSRLHREDTSGTGIDSEVCVRFNAHVRWRELKRILSYFPQSFNHQKSSVFTLTDFTDPQTSRGTKDVIIAVS